MKVAILLKVHTIIRSTFSTVPRRTALFSSQRFLSIVYMPEINEIPISFREHKKIEVVSTSVREPL